MSDALEVIDRLRAEEQRMKVLFDFVCSKRDLHEGTAFGDINQIKHAVSGRDPVLIDAADCIAALQAEVDRLRAALQPFLAGCFYDNGDLTIAPAVVCLVDIENAFWVDRTITPQRKRLEYTDKEALFKRVVGALRSARTAHPEINFACLETSIAKRIVGAVINDGTQHRQEG